MTLVLTRHSGFEYDVPTLDILNLNMMSHLVLTYPAFLSHFFAYPINQDFFFFFF